MTMSLSPALPSRADVVGAATSEPTRGARIVPVSRWETVSWLVAARGCNVGGAGWVGGGGCRVGCAAWVGGGGCRVGCAAWVGGGGGRVGCATWVAGCG